VKGGKHAYGWSEVSITGKVAILDESLKEYNLAATCKLFFVIRQQTFRMIRFNHYVVAEKFSFVKSIRRKLQNE
jgi:hypothetical protein